MCRRTSRPSARCPSEALAPSGAARPSARRLVLDLMEALVAEDAEVVTVITGEGADPAVVEALASWLADVHPDVEIEVHDGGQPVYPYLIGVE